jgi:UDPglucose--hexose-1-phosphate uridylyltransferase
MTADEIVPVIETWTGIYASHLSPGSSLGFSSTKASQIKYESLRPTNQLKYMQIFENKGAAMGCSNPHPHCQIWTTSTLPEEPGIELTQMSKYRLQNNGRHMLADYVELELEKQERVVWQNESFVILCPWWAVWPFETLVLPKRHVRALTDLTSAERISFAQAIQEVTRRYDNLFECSFPYSRYIPCPTK